MKKLALIPLALFASYAVAGSNVVIVTPPNRVPEPEMWALIGLAAAAIGAARLLKKRK